MEKNQTLPSMIYDAFQLKPSVMEHYSPLTLAYIGDSVYDMVIRTLLVGRANAPVKKLHRRASEIVKAEAQANLLRMIKKDLTDEELRMLKRGRNAKPASIAKNAKLRDYQTATGLEALIGFLYLTGRLDRVLELTKLGLTRMEINL